MTIGRRFVVAIVCAFVASVVGTMTNATQANADVFSTVPSDGGTGTIYGPSPTDDGYVYAYDSLSKTFVKVPASAAGTPTDGVSYRYAVTPDCPQARPFDAVNCTAAAQYCSQNGQSGIHEAVWRAEIAPDPSDYAIVGRLCTGSQSDPVPAQQVVAAASEYERTHVPIPVPNVQPATVALVNLPVIVSVPQPQPVTMQVQQPVPGTLVATPTFSWTFDDGATVTGPGVPYDGTDPRTDPTHYVSHTYATADAHASVTLTVTWNATFTAAGQVFPIAPLVMPPIASAFTVQEAHAVLVSGE